MRQIERFFSLTADRTLYHYTGIGSLVGIAAGGVLWASHVYYLNDSKEILHACDVLHEALKPRLVFGEFTPNELEFSKQFLEWSKTFYGNRYNLFVFSLSEERSLLSQWRSYTPHGKGISLGFSPNFLSSLTANNGLRIAKCIYTRPEQEEILRSLFEKLLLRFRELQPEFDPTKTQPEFSYYPFLEQFRGDVLQVLAVIKHEAFKEEREWRLVSRYFENFTVPEIDFREGSSMLVPYIKLKVGSERPIFETVVLGPSQHAELSFSALHMFLSNKKLSNSTENSNIPYRQW